MKRVRPGLVGAIAMVATVLATGGPAAAASPIWTRTASASSNSALFNELMFDIAAEQGAVYAIVRLLPDFDKSRLSLRSYSAGGSLRWKKDLGAESPGSWAGAVALDGTGLYATYPRDGTHMVRKVRRSSGQTLWTRNLEALLPGEVWRADVTTHGGDLLVVACVQGDDLYDRATVLRLDGGDGHVVGGPWVVNEDCDQEFIAIAANAVGIFVLDLTLFGDPVIIRADHDGDVRWTRGLPEDAHLVGITADPNGPYVTYDRYRSATGFDAHLRRYSNGGDHRWTKRVATHGNSPDHAGQPARDSQGVYLGWVGFDGSVPILGVRRYAPSGELKASWSYGRSKINLLRSLAAAPGALYAGGRGRALAVMQRIRK